MLNTAFILTHNRLELLRECINAIATQVDRLLVIDNASNPSVQMEDIPPKVHTLINDPVQPPNLARLMNIGFDWARDIALQYGTEWNVAVLCDDVIAPPDWYSSVATCIRETSAVAGSTHQVTPVSIPLVKTVPDADIYNRMQGSACIFRGEAGLRADERMHWWYQDTDLDWQARQAGGMVIAPGLVAYNSRPNDFTLSVPGLNEQAGRDGLVFKEKWGWSPW